MMSTSLKGTSSMKIHRELGITQKTARHRNHATCQHSVARWVDGQAHTNGLESFWSMLRCGYHGTFHRMSVKHLHRYAVEFAGRHNTRNRDTLEQMCLRPTGIAGKRLRYKDLIA